MTVCLLPFRSKSTATASSALLRKPTTTESNRTFTDEKQLRVVIDRIVAPIGRRVDESSPMCDARLPDGSRVNVIIPPLALNGSTITIRKFSQKRLGIQDTTVPHGDPKQQHEELGYGPNAMRAVLQQLGVAKGSLQGVN